MNWLQKISQTYPSKQHGRPWDFSAEKLDYLGYPHSSRHTERWDERELAMRSQLSAIPVERIKFAIDHLVGKYANEAVPLIKNSTENFCELDDAWSWEESPFIEQLRLDVTEISNSLVQRSEITDSELSKNLFSYLYGKVVMQISTLTKQLVANEIFWLRVYGTNRAYGGPEEGGWYYKDMKMVQDEQVRGLQAACHRKAQLEQEYANRGQDTFYDDLEAGHSNVTDVYNQQSSQEGMGDLDYEGDQEGMQFPIGWTPSAFEGFVVQVELTENPLSETGQAPPYQ